MRQQSATTEQRVLLDEVRSMMAPINPVAPTAFQRPPQDWAAPAQPSRNPGRWRVLAPVLSGLAVIAILAGITLAGGVPRPPTADGGSGALPRFYVTLNHLEPKETAVVHSTATGQVLSFVHITEAAGGIATIAAASSGRVFYLAASGRGPKAGQYDTILLRLSLSASGRSAKLTRLPGYLHDPTLPNALAPFVLGMAVSPNGRQLAAMMLVKNSRASSPVLRPVTELFVVPLGSGGRTEIWRAHGDLAYGTDVSWLDNNTLTYLWQDQIKGNEADFTGRTAVRQLNLLTSGRNLLKSTALMTGGGALGVIEGAFAPPGGGPIIAALARDAPAAGPKGTALVRLVAVSPVTGKITWIFASRVLHYSDDTARYEDNDYFGVDGFDASGKNALVDDPGFGMLRNGKFSALSAGPGEMHGVAW